MEKSSVPVHRITFVWEDSLAALQRFLRITCLLKCSAASCVLGQLISGGTRSDRHGCLQALSQEIRSATTSMTSVPKPLKFLMKHYDSLKAFYQSMSQSDNKPQLADVISILAISSGKKSERESLKYRLEGSKVGTS